MLLGVLLPGSQAFAADLPLGFPKPIQPNSSAALIDLGRHLFYDPRLSVNNTTSCSTCHRQSLAFTDGKTKSLGATGEPTKHNAMSLVNLSYRTSFGWQEKRNISDQLDRPLFGHEPIEMGMDPKQVPDNIENDAYYQTAFENAFGHLNAINWHNIKTALVAFELTLFSGNSSYDDWVFKDITPPKDIRKGFNLFHSERLQCGGCHGGTGFNNEFFIEGATPAVTFEENGVAPGETFRIPTLRNIAMTAPYMHDGSLESLEAVIDFYAAGPSPENQLKGFDLTDIEKQQLLAFLNALTDQQFLTDPAFTNPWTRENLQ